MSDSAGEDGESPSRIEDAQARIFPSGFPNLGAFIEKHTYKCFFVGTPALIFGSLLYISPMHNDLMNLFYISLMLIFIGGILIWIPVFYWMTVSTDQSHLQIEQPVSEPVVHPPFVPRMKPPDYDSIPPLGSNLVAEGPPPAYDEIFQNTESNLVVHTNDNDAATTNEETSSHQDHSQRLSVGTGHSQLSGESLTESSRDIHEADTQPLIP